jgi:hypothetical protein
MKYEEYLKTEYWSRVTKAVKSRAGYRCQVCNSQLDLNAHHRTYEHRGRELEFLDDLICMCRRCHAVFHGKIEVMPVIVEVPAQPQAAQQSPQQGKKHRIKGTPPAVNVEADMPPGDGPITLTEELVERTRTPAGSWTNASLRALGQKAPLIAGWPARLRGTTISREAYRAALVGRSWYGSGKLEKTAC